MFPQSMSSRIPIDPVILHTSFMSGVNRSGPIDPHVLPLYRLFDSQFFWNEEIRNVLEEKNVVMLLLHNEVEQFVSRTF